MTTATDDVQGTTLRRDDYDLEAAALVVRRPLSYERWEALGCWLEAAERGVQWWIGDWMVYGESAFGERYSQALTTTGWRIATVKQYHYVAARVPPRNRRPALSFFHHREVADLPPEEQGPWLDRAAAGDDDGEAWPTERLRRELKAAKTGSGVPCYILVKCPSKSEAEALAARLQGEGYDARVK